jgi:hypothetical protein
MTSNALVALPSADMLMLPARAAAGVGAGIRGSQVSQAQQPRHLKLHRQQKA